MNLLTYTLNVLGSGAVAYVTARQLRDTVTRPHILAGFQLAESGAVPFLEALRDRAIADGDQWLAEKLTRHANDEKRHGQIFASALKQMGKQVMDFKSMPKNDESRRSPFFEAYFQGYAPEELKATNIDWLVFMGSTYILELDACKDFTRMAGVLPDSHPRERALKQGILSVAKDEERHAQYLYEAMCRKLSESEVNKIIDNWRGRKVDAMFAMVGNFLQKGGKMNNLATDGVPVENQSLDLIAA
ncbi:MAG: hypothetical protein N5P05_001265 [Chroococcopsis gigantea SAG 12.99]|jgi:rubrerythrin|nr:ferritin-like domain-containing protein [Chlorogloea purpurea SAG 13.99]MDV2999659.1 hypothetical protein [Chroococcopsis gigantea SAG 12.99]